MGRWFTTRRSEWSQGAVTVGLAAGVAGAAGLSLGSRSLPVYAGLFAGALLLGGWAERLWLRRAARRALGLPSPRARGKLKVIDGGKTDAPFDLERDDSTDGQRWLM